MFNMCKKSHAVSLIISAIVAPKATIWAESHIKLHVASILYEIVSAQRVCKLKRLEMKTESENTRSVGQSETEPSIPEW